MFSSRLPPDLTPNPLTRLLEEKRERGETILDLTESNPTRAGFAYPESRITRAFAQPEMVRYEPRPRGLAQTRELVARAYAERGCAIDAGRMLLTASTSEAYAYLLKLLTDAGDHVLAPRPSYPLVEYLAAMEQVQCAPYDLRFERASGWRIDMDSLHEAWTEEARAVIVVNPNNPTGSYLRRADLDELLAFCAERDLALISDEVFFDYPLDNPRITEEMRAAAVSALQSGTGSTENDGPLVCTLGGFSKMLGLPQMKLGWIIVDGRRALAEAALSRLEFIADTFLSVGTPVQLAAEELLAAGLDIRAQILHRCNANLRTLTTAASGAVRVSLLPAEAGWYAMLAIESDEAEEDIVFSLLDEHDVLVQPGFFFDALDGCHLVLSLLPPEEDFAEGVRRLVEKFR